MSRWVKPVEYFVAMGEQDAVRIFGTDYPTPDGTAVRDYIHVDDLVCAHILALEAADHGVHRTFNLGNGAGFSVREVVDTARLVTGCQVPATESARRAGDPAVLVPPATSSDPSSDGSRRSQG